MPIQFTGLPTDAVHDIRESGIDAYGNAVERHHAPGGTYPCRHCLDQTSDDYLVLAHRPLVGVNPYAETGPIFLCAEACDAYVPSAAVPDILRSPTYIVRAYSAKERIVYGTGQVTPTNEIGRYAERLFEAPDVAFVDVRSAANNCFQCRILRV